jgi:hypothetical protein
MIFRGGLRRELECTETHAVVISKDKTVFLWYYFYLCSRLVWSIWNGGCCICVERAEWNDQQLVLECAICAQCFCCGAVLREVLRLVESILA